VAPSVRQRKQWRCTARCLLRPPSAGDLTPAGRLLFLACIPQTSIQAHCNYALHNAQMRESTTVDTSPAIPCSKSSYSAVPRAAGSRGAAAAAAASRLPLGRRQRPPPLIPRRRAGGKASQAHEEVDEGDDEDGRQRRRDDAHDDARAAVVDVERLLWRRINKISKQCSSAPQLCGEAVI